VVVSDGSACLQCFKYQRRSCPFTLDVQGVGRLLVPWGSEPALAVEKFASEALDSGHFIDKVGVGGGWVGGWLLW
jgi:hypothetical protein